MRLVLSLALVTVLAASANAQPVPRPRAPGARVVTIAPENQRASEPSIALDPFHPERVAGAFGGPVVAYSTDSARTFAVAEGTRVTGGGWRGGGDVSLTFDDKGRLFLSYLTTGPLGTPSYWAHDRGGSGIWVRRSPDGGRTWDAEPHGILVWPTGKEPGSQFEDMPRIWSDVGARSPHRGNLYVGWIQWRLDSSIILFSRSTDGGATWSAPKRISTHAGYPRDDNGALVGVIGTVAPDGTMYVVWNDGLTVAFTTSRDGGRTFAPSRSVIDVGPPYFGGATGVPGVARVMGFPQIGVDPRRGTLYVTWSDFRNGDVDVFIARSADGGRTWTRPTRVNDDPIHDGADQFFQWLAVDPTNGDVYVQFYDRRDDPAHRRTGVTLARSTDGGRSFVNYAWSEGTFESDNAFLGDYMWLAAYGGRVYGIWAEAVRPDTTAAAPATPAAPARRAWPTIMRVGTADFTAPRRAGR